MNYDENESLAMSKGAFMTTRDRLKLLSEQRRSERMIWVSWDSAREGTKHKNVNPIKHAHTTE
jgi:hypothetical protein